MLSAFGRAFRTPDLRRKLLFTIAIMALFRVGGSLVPTPGVDYGNVQQCVAALEGSTSLLGLVNVFSGGALLQLSIFALGIMPYITASIIVQLLRVVIPRFEALHKEGQSGQAKLTQYTRYLTIALAILQSTTIITTARTGMLFQGCPVDVIADDSFVTATLMVITMTAGTGLVMWLGEMITERGVGNGMSLLIFTSIAASFPSALWSIAGGSNGPPLNFIVMILVIVLVVGLVVFVEQSQRRIPVQYAKRMVGRRMYGGTSTYIPIKINMAGVIPVIFAASILAIPRPDRPVRRADGGLGRVDLRQPGPAVRPAVHRAVRADGHLLRVLLHVDHVQPGRGRGQHEEVRRLHPGHPRGPAHGRVPRLRDHPHHVRGLDLPGDRGAHPPRSCSWCWESPRTSRSAARRSSSSWASGSRP